MAAHMAAHVEEITLIDADTNEDFKLILNSEDAIRARNGKNINNNIFININYYYNIKWKINVFLWIINVFHF